MKVADKLSPLTPQPSPMGQGAVGWALGVILRWPLGARSFGSPRGLVDMLWSALVQMADETGLVLRLPQG